MAYIADNLVLLFAPITAGIGRRFEYTTAADSDATIVTAGYFSDGYLKGMRVGDIVGVVATTGPKYKVYQVSAVNTSTGAVTVTAPTAIT